jgi:histidinol-phosphate aminotransferase
VTNSSDKIDSLIRPEIQALSAYHVPDPGDMVKLDAMENPYQWPDALVENWLSTLRSASLNRYPDPAAVHLNEQLHKSFRVPAGMSTMLGNGSDELIQIITMAVNKPGSCILAPEPSFVMYKMIADFIGMNYEGVPLSNDSFELDMDAMREAIDKSQPAVVFIAYPNNPTGNLFQEDQVREIIECSPGLVVIDEAYAAFADHSFMPDLGNYDNLLVMRTVSKMGLAGLRLGMLAGPPEWISEFDKVRLPYNINVLTQLSAEFALEHKQVLDEQTRTIRKDRDDLMQALISITGIRAYASQANFILFHVPEGQADTVYQSMLEDGVLIKNLNSAGGALRDCLRVTVGRPEENDRFLDVLQKALDTINIKP